MDGIGAYIGRGYYAEVFEYGEGKVIKLFDDGRGLEKAKLEARITDAARESGIPAPRIWEAASVNDRAGIVMERIEGETMLHWGTSLPWRVYTGGKMMARLQADVHSRRGADIPALPARLLDGIQQAPGVSDSVKERALERVESLPDGDSICHGDFHPDNIIMSRGKPVIIDWEYGAKGNPAADVARTVLLVESGVPLVGGIRRAVIETARKIFLSIYLKEYFKTSGMAWEDVSPWMLPVAVNYANEVFPEHLDDHLSYMKKFH